MLGLDGRGAGLFLWGPIIRKKQDPMSGPLCGNQYSEGQESFYLVVSRQPLKVPEQGSDKVRGVLVGALGMEETGVGNATQWAGAEVPREVTGQGHSPLAAWGRPAVGGRCRQRTEDGSACTGLFARHFLRTAQDVCAAGAPSYFSTVRGLGDVRRGLFHSLGVGWGWGCVVQQPK